MSSDFKPPKDSYTAEELADVYTPKGKEEGNAIAELDYDNIFVPLIDRVLGGVAPRDIAKWLRNSHSKNIHPNAIDKYIRDYIPEDIREKIRLSSTTFRNAQIDPIALLEDLIHKQKELISSAFKERKKDPHYKFNFNKEMALLHKMTCDLIEQKQSLGKAPKAPQKHVHEHVSGSEQTQTDKPITQAQAARVIGLIEKLLKAEPPSS